MGDPIRRVECDANQEWPLWPSLGEGRRMALMAWQLPTAHKHCSPNTVFRVSHVPVIFPTLPQGPNNSNLHTQIFASARFSYLPAPIRILYWPLFDITIIRLLFSQMIQSPRSYRSCCVSALQIFRDGGQTPTTTHLIFGYLNCNALPWCNGNIVSVGSALRQRDRWQTNAWHVPIIF